MTGFDEDRELDALLAAARRRAPHPSEALMSRIAADADAVQAGFAAPSSPRGVVSRRPRRAGFLREVLGGWPAAAGLVAAAAAGVWIGVVPPPALEARARLVLGLAQVQPLVDTMPGTGLDLIEGGSL